MQVLIVGLLLWRTLPSYLWLSHQDTRDDQGHRRQSIEHTCGPVSLANLIEVCHGNKAPSERELAKRSHTTMEGTPLTGLITAARQSGLELKVCRIISMSELRNLNAPALVQISTLPSVRHASLLLKIEGDEAHFIDPAYGYRKISCERFRKIWYGKTLIFERKM
jgi:predicted double-glycine peptidase